MATFRINEGFSDTVDVEADHFMTVGMFVDFTKEGIGVVFRIAADRVRTIKRVQE
ncbi:hypothetical protein [Nocardiopsis sp. CNR-923]|uniref:hypothetical protein n=1 Tax=Nocardiopsis sp. CNR-923 TaxID=1904965 RepID=UPI00130104B2|nr:hypothetical protein [Nocardiopsis sp. CNR-923]